MNTDIQYIKRGGGKKVSEYFIAIAIVQKICTIHHFFLTILRTNVCILLYFYEQCLRYMHVLIFHSYFGIKSKIKTKSLIG